MAVLDKSKQLRKELSLLKIYALATGATLSSGFFLLPGLAAAQAGPAVVLCYLIAAVHLIPAVFSMAELSTAMPRAGGIYYFLDRSLGPLFGTIGGIGTWLALVLKIAFALIGMGAYLSLFFRNVPILPLAIGLAFVFGWINLFGAKKSGGFQVVLVIGLLIILGGFMGHGLSEINLTHFRDFWGAGFDSIYSTAGLVYVSYVGITKIASVAEEVKNPERNLPLGMFLALITAIGIFAIGTTVMVGVIPPQKFYNDLTPVATAAKILMGPIGAILVSVAAVLSFFSVSNAAVLSASRYPLAMSRDHLFPRFFRRLNKHRTPHIGIYVTVLIVILILLVFNPTKIAKLASAFQLLLFALSCLAVVIMRESKIESYDPGYRSPFYPWMQIFGIIAPMFLIVQMGIYSTLFIVGLIIVGTVWYFTYARTRVVRGGAIYHMFAKWGERKYLGLDRELRGIMIEKGLRKHDPFDFIIAHADIIDISKPVTFENVVQQASERIAQKLNVDPGILIESFLQGTRVGATPVSHGVALPHTRLPNLTHPEIVIIRAKQAVVVDIHDAFLGQQAHDEPVHAFFFLISPEDNPGQHLRLLAQIAGQVDNENFMKSWLKAKDEQQLKELLCRADYSLSLQIKSTDKSAHLVGMTVNDAGFPEGTLVTLIRREGDVIIPGSSTILKENDLLTIIGEPFGIRELRQAYIDGDA